MAEQVLLPSNRRRSNKAQQWLPVQGSAHVLCYIRTLWVQCAGIFLTDSFPTSDFYFTCLFNFGLSFFKFMHESLGFTP